MCGVLTSDKITVCGYLYGNNASQSRWKLLPNTKSDHNKINLDEKINPEVEDILIGVAGEFIESINLDENTNPEVQDILIGIAGEFVESAGTPVHSSGKHSKSKILEAEDLVLNAEKTQNISLLGLSGNGNKLCKKQLQFTVKAWNGTSVSIQKDVDSTTVRSLIESTCEKLGAPALDAYAVLEGKALDNDEYLSHYSISRDSNVEIRLRLRAGQYKTFDEQFNIDEAAMFEEVQLPPILTKQGVAVPVVSVKFFSYLSTCYLHEILKYVTGNHRQLVSFNGAFDSRDIWFIAGRAYIRANAVSYDRDSCARDYYRLYEIFSMKFSQYGYPVYFSHLMHYLQTCPAGAFSNTEAVIGFVTNHPCLEPYQDRMKQIMLLDNIIPRLSAVDQQTLTVALGTCKNWADNLHGVPEMDRIYYHYNTVDGAGAVTVNPLYVDAPRGCLHYSNNYMKHATNQVEIEVLEAAYCLHFREFLPEVLLKLALFFHHESIIALLADKREKERS